MRDVGLVAQGFLYDPKVDPEICSFLYKHRQSDSGSHIPRGGIGVVEHVSFNWMMVSSGEISPPPLDTRKCYILT